MAYAVVKHEEFGLSKAVLEKYTPTTWSGAKSPGEEVQLIELSASSREYVDVLNKIKATMPTISVRKVQRVQNPYLWGAYLLKKAENAYLQEKKLFHATAQFNITSIVSNNYDWRRTVRSKFGKGVSFSPSAAYADKYCNMRVGTERAMILNRVLVGRTLSGSQFTEVPTAGYDTTTGNTGNVYVKYGDNDFYPEYVAYYSNSHTSASGSSSYRHSRGRRRSYYHSDSDFLEMLLDDAMHADDDHDLDMFDIYDGDNDYDLDMFDIYDGDNDYDLDMFDIYDGDDYL